MAGNITHSWNGSILTVTSDSGTTSADLRGPQGAMGIRGPQGPAGKSGAIIYKGGLTEEVKTALINCFSNVNWEDESNYLDALQTALNNAGTDTGGGGDCVLTEEIIVIGEVGDIAVTRITLDYTSIELDVGNSMMLAASVVPSNATNNIVLWKSSDTSVATVNNGYVTAIANGSAVITAYSAENNAIKATCSVSVATGSGSGSSGKVLFSSLTPIKEGVVLHKKGTTEFAHDKTAYYQIPYSEGMEISTLLNSAWLTNYPPFIVVEDGNITVPEATYDKFIADMSHHYTITLSGYSEDAKVYVNVLKSNTESLNDENCYYIVGGAK